jgi:predicted glycogen debranching enzyme
MADLVRVLPRRALPDPESDPDLSQEWLVTNGLGGYASGTVTGAITRRYHGLLIAALPNPMGRMMMLNGLSERLRLPDRRVVYTGAEELAGAAPERTLPLSEFRLEAGLPVWRYEIDGFALEKRLAMIYRQNTVHITYRLVSGRGNCGSAFVRQSIFARTMRPSVRRTPSMS